MNKLGGFIRLMRPVNCTMMGFAVLVGAVLASPQLGSLNWLNILFGFLTGFTFCAAAMVINDYYDRKIDAINEPHRPIPSGIIKPKEALGFVVVLSAVGFVFAGLVSAVCFVVAAASLAITATYLTVGKRSGLPGNFLVSACVAIPFIYGSITAIGTVGLNVVLFASMAFLSNTGREITKGIVDVKGDSVDVGCAVWRKKRGSHRRCVLYFCCGFNAFNMGFGVGGHLVCALCFGDGCGACGLFGPFADGSFSRESKKNQEGCFDVVLSRVVSVCFWCF
jgi:hypothetical protein